MKVLVACECSGRVREAFRKLGHEAWSCDIKEDENGEDYFHMQDDVVNQLDNDWDLMIAHPPCTYMCRNRARLNEIQDKDIDTDLFMTLMNANIEKICIENPVPSYKAGLPKYTQIIQPYQFGHDYSKKTCLWLKNLPKLKPTKIMEIRNKNLTPSGQNKLGPSKDRGMKRSRTYPGIAHAMANQWK